MKTLQSVKKVVESTLNPTSFQEANDLELRVKDTLSQQDKSLFLEVVKTSSIALLGFSSTICKKKERRIVVDCIKASAQQFSINYVNVDPTYFNMIRLTINSLFDTVEILNVKSLDQFNTKIMSDHMMNCLKLTCDITGYSLQEVLNLRFKNNPVVSGFNNLKKSDDNGKVLKRTFEVLNYKVESTEYREATTPSLTNRISIAFCNYVMGDAPNQFNFSIQNVHSLVKAIKKDLVKMQTDIMSETYNIIAKKESFIDEDGNILLTK